MSSTCPQASPNSPSSSSALWTLGVCSLWLHPLHSPLAVWLTLDTCNLTSLFPPVERTRNWMQRASAGDVTQSVSQNRHSGKQHSILLKLTYLMTRKIILYPGLNRNQKTLHPVAEAVAVQCDLAFSTALSPPTSPDPGLITRIGHYFTGGCFVPSNFTPSPLLCQLCLTDSHMCSSGNRTWSLFSEAQSSPCSDSWSFLDTKPLVSTLAGWVIDTTRVRYTLPNIMSTV